MRINFANASFESPCASPTLFIQCLTNALRFPTLFSDTSPAVDRFMLSQESRRVEDRKMNRFRILQESRIGGVEKREVNMEDLHSQRVPVVRRADLYLDVTASRR